MSETEQVIVSCSVTTTVPTMVRPDALTQQSTGYPDDAVTTCCRIRGHDGQHFTVLPLASAPGSFGWSW